IVVVHIASEAISAILEKGERQSGVCASGQDIEAFEQIDCFVLTFRSGVQIVIGANHSATLAKSNRPAEMVVGYAIRRNEFLELIPLARSGGILLIKVDR